MRMPRAYQSTAGPYGLLGQANTRTLTACQSPQVSTTNAARTQIDEKRGLSHDQGPYLWIISGAR